MWKYLLEKEFKQFFRDPGLPRMALAFPVLMMLVFPFAVSMDIRNINLAVVDNCMSRESALLVEKCSSSGYFRLVDVCHDPSEAQKLMDAARRLRASGDKAPLIFITNMAQMAVRGMQKTFGVRVDRHEAAGVAFGAFLRLKERDEKGANLGYALSGILGGVTEPALYGCGFKYMRSLGGMAIGGAIGGLIAGVFHVTTYVLGATNILGLIGYAGGGTANLMWGAISSVVAFVVAAAITFLFGFTKEQLEEDARLAAEA